MAIPSTTNSSSNNNSNMNNILLSRNNADVQLHSEPTAAAADNAIDQNRARAARQGRALTLTRFLRSLSSPVQVVPKVRGVVNHSYNDFSTVRPTAVAAFVGGHHNVNNLLREISFGQKLHHILSCPMQYGKVISWLPHGRSFKIHQPQELEKLGGILETFFGHNRYSIFLRQLNNHGFKHITGEGKGIAIDRNSYYHECMLRSMPHLVVFLPSPRDARRLQPDPEHELNFYEISAASPLPTSAGATSLRATALNTISTMYMQQQPQQQPQQPRSDEQLSSSSTAEVSTLSSSSSVPLQPLHFRRVSSTIDIVQNNNGSETGSVCINNHSLREENNSFTNVVVTCSESSPTKRRRLESAHTLSTVAVAFQGEEQHDDSSLQNKSV